MASPDVDDTARGSAAGHDSDARSLASATGAGSMATGRDSPAARSSGRRMTAGSLTSHRSLGTASAVSQSRRESTTFGAGLMTRRSLQSGRSGGGAGEGERRVDPQAVVVPRRFLCPLTGLLMRDPVMIETGDSYERAAVTAWFQRQARDPMSGNPLYSVQMVRNAPLAKEITEWLEARPGVEITLSEMAHDRFMQLVVENQEQYITTTFKTSSFGKRHYGKDRHPSEDFYFLVFEPPPAQRAQEALELGLKMLSRTAAELKESATVTTLLGDSGKPRGAKADADRGAGADDATTDPNPDEVMGKTGAMQVVTRPVRRPKARDDRPVLTEDVKNLLARLKLQQYENVFRDWGFSSLETIMYLEEVHLAEMGMRVGPRLALMDSLNKLKRAVAARNKHVAKVAAEALLRNEGRDAIGQFAGRPAIKDGHRDSHARAPPPALHASTSFAGSFMSAHAGQQQPLRVLPPTSPLRLAMYNQQQQSFHNMAHTLQQQQSMWLQQQQHRQAQREQQQQPAQSGNGQQRPVLGTPMARGATSPTSTLYSHPLSYRSAEGGDGDGSGSQGGGASEREHGAGRERSQRQPPLVPTNSYSGRVPRDIGAKKRSRHLVKETSVFYLRAQEEKVRREMERQRQQQRGYSDHHGSGGAGSRAGGGHFSGRHGDAASLHGSQSTRSVRSRRPTGHPMSPSLRARGGAAQPGSHSLPQLAPVSN